MDDKEIVALYWARKEEAITQSQMKYTAYCHAIAKNILRRFSACISSLSSG